MSDDCISRQAVLDTLDTSDRFMDEDRTVDTYKALLKECYEVLPSVTPKQKMGQWIPIKTRPLSDKEKEEYADLGYSEDSISFMYDCPLPDDGQEVFITTRYGEVKTDTFYRDEGCYFETYCDEDDVKAWMPLPEPYEAESED